jgi:branched-chain amino acid transport system ATP-binding protein
MLAVRDLHVRFGGIEALRGVSIGAGPGRIVAVLGRNGAGKTTLLRAVSGLVRPWRGTIAWNDRPIGSVAPAGITRMGIVQVPEGRRVLTELTVRENLLLGSYGQRRGRSHRRDRDRRLDQTLQLFPILAERLDSSGAALSGGQQQMLAISRGLMASPELLMIDELSLGLAPVVVEELACRLKQLRAEGIGILLVEQEYPLALRLADYVYVLQKGRVRWEGQPDEARHVLLSSYLGQQTVGAYGR